MSSAQFIVVGIALALNACATSHREVDGMCAAIAAFANAPDAGNHSVRLSTDWGGVYTKSEDPDEWVMAAKRCDHSGFEPGKSLCGYLIEETSTEFPRINYRRALRCMGVRVSGRSPTDDRSLPPSATSRHVLGVRPGVSVKVELLPGTDTSPPTLEISAHEIVIKHAS
jgi:hypothetical protein